MKNIDILHIYAGTSGSAGLYMNEIYSVLSDNFRQELIVNSYYPFQKGKKIFYRYSELSAPYKIKRRAIRLAIRFVELCYALLFSLFYVLRNNPKILNYSLTSDVIVEYYFLCIIKIFTKTKLLITCHDTLPLNISNEKILQKKIKRKKRFFKLADTLIIHNQNSREELEKYYGITANIVEHPFPVMDLTLLYGLPEVQRHEKFKVSMLGNFRKEKGVDILVDAWSRLDNDAHNIELLIAGYFPDRKDIPANLRPSVHIKPHFIDDHTYWKLIGESDVVVLPYKRGTNSGIPSSIISLNTLLIASDISMFDNNTLIDKFFLFKMGDAVDLSKKIYDIYQMSQATKNEYRKKNKILFNQYRQEFKSIINEVYLSILEK